jgi:PAS domain S-box-containing protein
MAMPGESILVVEDQPTTAATVRMQLEGLGYHIADVCYTGEQAVARALEVNPQLVLMDIVLGPGMDGIEAARQIRDARQIPIVYMTAYADEQVVELAKETDPAGFINKPVTSKDLLATLGLAFHTARGRSGAASHLEAGATSNSASIFCDVSGAIRYVNRAAETATGLDRLTLVGKSLNEVIQVLYGRTSKEAAARIEEVVRTRKTQIISHRTTFERGNVHDTYDTISPVFDTRGELSGFNLILDDRTIPRRLAELDQTIDALAIAFETIPTGVVAVDAGLGIKFMNRAAHELLSGHPGLTSSDGRLGARDDADQRRLQKLLADTLRLEREQAPLRITTIEDNDPIELVIQPVHASPGSRGIGPVAMIFMFDSANEGNITEEALIRLYGLTVAEAKVARLLVLGKSLEAVASELDISVHTVRTHLKHVFQKTGTRRQAELVHKLETGPAVLGLGRWSR